MAAVPIFRSRVAAGTLDTYCEALGTVLEEARVHCEATGLRADMTDAAEVAQVEATLGGGAFADYGAPGRDHDTPTIAIDIGAVRDRLGLFGPDTVVELDVDAASRTLAITGDTAGFSLATIDPEMIRESPGDPDLDLPASVTVEPWVLDGVVRAADTANADGVAVRLLGETGALQLAAEGTDSRNKADAVEQTLGPGDAGVVEPPSLDADVVEPPALDADATVGARYSLDNLRALLRPIPAGASVELAFGDGLSLELRWQFADTAGVVVNRLAPLRER